MKIPAGLKFTENHEWVREEGAGVISTGITGFAQDALGDIVYFEAPAVGDEVEKGAEFCVVESVKAVSDVYAPLTGTIVEVNEDVMESPELINESPYESGWLVKIEMSDPAELDALMDPDDYEDFLKTA